MKNILRLLATAIFVCCIVPIAITQAMTREVHDKGLFFSTPPNADSNVSKQKELLGMVAELYDPEIKDSIPTYDRKKPCETTIAQVGTSTTAPSTGKANPHVKRRGHGRSKMGDNVTEKNTADNEHENEESEKFGDDSAVKYNRDLKNSSGYNEDL